MIVSILQLMGFPVGKPVHSRASENSEHAQAQQSRNKDVKTQVGKPKVATKVQIKAKKVAVVAKPAKKPPAKTPARPVVKTSAKVVPKSVKPVKSAKPSKPTAKVIKKPLAKVAAVKPVAKKAITKTAAKTAVKTAVKKVVAKKALVKAVVKAPVKAPVKALPKPKIQKPAPKVAAKKVNVVVNKNTKPEVAAKPSVKPSVKPPVKTVAPVVVAKAAPVAVAPVAAVVPPKAGRPSSRLAQLTVPSMAQSVASTAAKSSFTQHTALPLIVPPLASATKKDPKLANNWKTRPVEQMSNEELLAMPDSEYMNEKQMAVFRLKLSVLKQDILNSAGETTEHLREDTVVVPDPADRATIEEEHALELRTRDRERKLLKKIEQSINRIDAGDYGYCDETGEPIGVGRLLARPTATLSLEAQQRRELKQKMFGD